MVDKIVLREVLDGDLPTFFAHQQDPIAIQMATFASRDRAAFDAHWSKILHDPAVVVRTILLDDTVAGYVAKFERMGLPEVCYWIDRAHWGRGVATAALEQLLLELGERPLYARVSTDHRASLRVLEKCGFVACGQGRDYDRTSGEEIEELILELRSKLPEARP